MNNYIFLFDVIILKFADPFPVFFGYLIYFGYTKTADSKTEEYKLQHPSWKISEVLDYQIDCDFEAMYGKSFSVLNQTEPEAVFIADGSAVGIEWKRTKINLENERR